MGNLWSQTSPDKAATAEAAMLAPVKTPYELRQVPIKLHGIDTTINTIILGQGPPLVLVNGFAAAIGWWSLNYDHLARTHTVYCFDVPGFGRSGRTAVPADIKDAESARAWFVEGIDAWRQAMGIDRAAWLGHSMGGYLAAEYARVHASRILCDPWGVPPRPESLQTPLKWRLLISVLYQGGALAMFRLAGPWGPNLIRKARGDFIHRFASVYGENSMTTIDYLYHTNAQYPTGELMFKMIEQPVGWARIPLSTDALLDLPADMPVCAIYGAHSWMDYRALAAVRAKMNTPCEIYRLPFAGHHVYADNAGQFNQLLTLLLSGEAVPPEMQQYRVSSHAHPQPRADLAVDMPANQMKQPDHVDTEPVGQPSPAASS